MSWTTILDQERVKQLLRSSIARSRIPHAYLFSGPEGVGKYATAIELAKTLLCESKTDVAWNECKACRAVSALQHPGVSLVFALPVGKGETVGDGPLAKLTPEEVAAMQEQYKLKAANPYHVIALPRASEIKINSIREIRRDLSLTTFAGENKVIILLEAEKMNIAASNALLKTLEEPQENVLFVLTTAFPDRLLPTIRSRCQLVRFDPLSDAVIKQGLIEREHVKPEKAAIIARLSNGNYAHALRYLHTDLEERRSEAIDFLRVILRPTRKDLIDKIDQITSEFERDEIAEVLRLLQIWLREGMLVKEKVSGALDENSDQVLRKFVAHYPNLDYISVLDAIGRAVSLLDRNVYIPLILMELSLRLRDIIRLSASTPQRGQTLTTEHQ